MIGFEQLNNMQQKAVMQTEGPVLVLAGAGSGKTGALTVRIAHLLETGVKPWNILAITFTNKAAKEMRERVDKLVGQGAEDIWISTFHSTCVRILRRRISHLDYDGQFSIYDADESGKSHEGSIQTPEYEPHRQEFFRACSHFSDQQTEKGNDRWEDYAKTVDPFDIKGKRLAKVYQLYQQLLKESNALDFDDLIYKTVLLFRTHPEVLDKYQERFRYIMVDSCRILTHLSMNWCTCWRQNTRICVW